jgi:hypothetical protein
MFEQQLDDLEIAVVRRANERRRARVFVGPVTFAGLKNSCMFGLAPRSSSSLTIARPVVLFIGSMDARPPSTWLRRPIAVNSGASRRCPTD